MIVLVLTFAGLLSETARAGTAEEGAPGATGPTSEQPKTDPGGKGVVVRMEARSEAVLTPVVAHLLPSDGAPLDVQLKDDGQAPDVTAGDTIWSGTVWATGDTFTVTLSLGAKTLDGGALSWSPDEKQRDLTLTLSSGGLKAEAAAAQPFLEPGTAAGAGGEPGAAGDKPPGLPPNGGSGASDTKAQPRPYIQTGDDATLYVAFGVGALLLTLIGYLWMRGGSAGDGVLPAGVTRVREPGILGVGTPSLSDGLSLWVAAPNDAHDLVRPLLTTLAQHHRVIVSAPPEGSVPSVRGASVYRVTTGKPTALGDAAEALAENGAGGVAVMMLGDGLDASTLKRHADALPEGVGGAVVLMQVPSATLPVVHCERREDLWHLRIGDTEIVVREGARGFERVG